MSKTFHLLLLTLFSVVLATSAKVSAQQDTSHQKTRIYVFEIFDEIAAPTWRITQKALKEAREIDADIVILHLNTYGGAVDAADSIRTAILNFPKPVWVFVDNNAASAGALISIACDSIYMRKGANIGAATVVNQNAEAMPDKYQSYMRSMMRSTAEAQGRDPLIAQCMVDPDMYVEGISDSGKVLTFTTSEAIANGFCEGQAESIDEVIAMNGITDFEIVKMELSTLDRIINFLINPLVSGLLVMLIIGGIYFELQTPGVGFPLAVAIIAALLFFAPHYLEGLTEHWEILVFLLGLVLLVLEIFVIPGFGVAGISGIILIITGLTLAVVANSGLSMPDGDYGPLVKSFAIVSFSMFFALILSFYISSKLARVSVFGQSMALQDEFDSSKGYIASEQTYHELIGKAGIAYTVLRPSGKIVIDDEQYDATAMVGYIEKNERVKVVGYENMQLIVRKE
ncbi:MAG: serine protease [Bacteroidetes bacterium HGW-Bacteroidetes-6]|nr:MAG: serine protease [Bacteroidetes bacterium HGW-Bacteroidetes-6]